MAGLQELSLDRVSKHYGTVAALNDVSLSVARGEFLTLLGPSGSGKTTMLMAIAGFVAPTSGRILLNGQPIQHLPPDKRDFGMVFQGYALFPHLTVAKQHRLPARGARHAASPRSTGRSATRWVSSSSVRWPTGCRASSRAASSSGWRSPARWSSRRTCCCSTSR